MIDSELKGLVSQTREALDQASCVGDALRYRTKMYELLEFYQIEAFSASSTEAHFTASAVILNLEGAPLALLHAKLNRWLQPGGHIESTDASPLEAALREIEEETGLNNLHILSPYPIDLDIHTIPARGTVGTHDHYDLRFGFLLTQATSPRVNHEAHALAWLTGSDLEQWLKDPSIYRAYQKANQLRMMISSL